MNNSSYRSYGTGIKTEKPVPHRQTPFDGQTVRQTDRDQEEECGWKIRMEREKFHVGGRTKKKEERKKRGKERKNRKQRKSKRDRKEEG